MVDDDIYPVKLPRDAKTHPLQASEILLPSCVSSLVPSSSPPLPLLALLFPASSAPCSKQRWRLSLKTEAWCAALDACRAMAQANTIGRLMKWATSNSSRAF